MRPRGAGLGIWLGRVLRPGSASERGGFFLGRRESRAAPEPGGQGTRVWGAEPSFCSGNRLCQSRCGSAPSRANDAPVFPESSLADELPHRMQIWYRDNGFGFGVQNWHQSRRFGTLKPLKNLSKEPKVTTNVHLTLELLETQPVGGERNLRFNFKDIPHRSWL